MAAIERGVRVGALIPNLEDFDTTDPVAVAEAKMALQEFRKVQDEIESIIAEGSRH